jgi:hypothetical protein
VRKGTKKNIHTQAKTTFFAKKIDFIYLNSRFSTHWAYLQKLKFGYLSKK